MPKPGIDQLLIRSALDPDLLRRLKETPHEVFAEYDLTGEQQDLLLHPDHRLLPLLGAALARPQETPAPRAPQSIRPRPPPAPCPTSRSRSPWSPAPWSRPTSTPFG